MSTIKLVNDNEIIMVDDDEMEFMIARRFLKKSKVTNQLVTFDDHREFLTYISQVASGNRPIPALVMLDVRMGSISGFELLQQIRTYSTLKELPIVMMFSNSNLVSDIKRAEDLGANGYQVKPDNGKDFVAFFNSLIPTEKLVDCPVE
jgi:CheY-like chemotaxis protein